MQRTSLSRRAFARLLAGSMAMAAVSPEARAGPPSLLGTVPRRRIRFDVRALDRVIGSHEVEIEGSTGSFSVRSDVDIAVTIFGLSVFSYRHTGVEVWEDDRLVAFNSKTVGDKRTERVVGRALGDGFRVEGRKGVIVAPADIMVGSFWTPRMMARDVVLDPQKGVLEDQVIRERVQTTWPVGGEPVPVTRYRISSVLKGEIAYDETGLWVGAKFRKKSTDIEYRLRS